MIRPKALQKGDLVYITAPAKAIEEVFILHAKKWLEGIGLKVEIANHCLGQNNYFSGSDMERISDFQKGLDSNEIKAIFCARGGYGCVRIVDRLDWSKFIQNPKWIVGFSDVTVFHHKCSSLGIESLHATMPFNFNTNSKESLETLQKQLTGENVCIEFNGNDFNMPGNATGRLIGGNLSILCSLLSTPLSYNFENAILFIEDIGEHVYQIDRMLISMEKSGLFKKLNGVIVGGMTDIQDTDTPFGCSVEEIIKEKFNNFSIPLAFGLQAGHLNDNRALAIGREVTLKVEIKGSELAM